MKKALFSIFLLFFGVWPSFSFAGSLLMQGVLEDTSYIAIPNQTGMSVTVTYKNPSGTCVLGTETFTAITTDAVGKFYVSLGTGSLTPTAPAATFEDIFDNSKSWGCYMSPAVGDTRLIVASISGGSPTNIAPAIVLNMTANPFPFALTSKLAENVKGTSTTATANSIALRDGAGALSATSFIGSVSGNVTGNLTGTASNATTAVSFSGALSGDVTGSQGATSVGKIQGRTVSATPPTSGQVLTWNNGMSQWEPQNAAGGGTVTGVFAGAGLSSNPGGGITGNGTLSVNIANSATLSNAKFWLGDGANKAQEIAMSGDATLSNSGILTLNNSGVTTGTYTKLTVDAKGRATAGTSLAAADVTTALGFNPINKAGDTAVGDLVQSAQKSFQVGAYSTAQEGAFTSGLVGTDAGKVWYNSNTQKVRFWNGSGAADIGGGGAGTVTSVGAGTGLTGGPITTSGALNVDVGLGPGKIPQVDGSGIPANAVLLSNGVGAALTAATLTPGQILVGNGSSIPTPTSLSGDATMTPSGVLTINTGLGGFIKEGGNSPGGAMTLGTNNSNPLVLRTNSTTRMLIDSAGNIGIGTLSPSFPLDIRTAPAGAPMLIGTNMYADISSGSKTGVLNVTAHPTFNSAQQFAAIHGEIDYSSATGTTSGVGVMGEVKLTGAQIASFVNPVYSSIDQGSTATLSNVSAFRTDIKTSGTGIITDARGVEIQLTGSGGAITNGYGVYINNMTNVTNKWGIYSADASVKSYFAGNVGVGTSSPGFLLDVNGTVNAGTYKLNGQNAISANSGAATLIVGNTAASTAALASTAVGHQALNVDTAGYSTGVGSGALLLSSAIFNVGLGFRAGDYITTGNSNTFIGTNANTSSAGVTAINNSVALGASSQVGGNYSIAIGASAIATANGDITIGSANNTGLTKIYGGASPAIQINSTAKVQIGTNGTPIGNILTCSALIGGGGVTYKVIACNGLPSGGGTWNCNCTVNDPSSGGTPANTSILFVKPGYSGTATAAANNIYVAFSASIASVASSNLACMCFN